MSCRCSPEEKSAALRLRAGCGGSVFIARRKTGIPERTPARWKHHYKPVYGKMQQQQENEVQQQQQ